VDRQLPREGVAAVRGCRSGMRLVVDIGVAVVGRWERAAAWGGEAVLWCRVLVGGRVFGWVGRRR
jgi:Holliday junction resolvase